MRTLQRVILFPVLVTCFSLPLAPNAAQERRLKWLSLSLPISETSICSAAPMWGAVARVPIGVECMWSPNQISADRVSEELDLSGLRVEDSLDLMRRHMPDYDVRFDGVLAVFRPIDRTRSPSILDRTIPQFNLSNASLVEAAEAVNRLFDSFYRSHEVPRPYGRIVANSERDKKTTEEIIDRYNRRFQKTLTLGLTGQTVERILTAVAIKSGASWRVMYVRPEKRYEDCVIEFLTGDAAPVQSGPARVPRTKRDAL